jgi:hypothetical protein
MRASEGRITNMDQIFPSVINSMATGLWPDEQKLTYPMQNTEQWKKN